MRNLRSTRSTFVIFVALVLSLATAAIAYAASASADLPHAHVELVSETTGMGAPGVLHAGLHFKLEAGWHVYWKNPGDAGEPPRIGWSLPQGVTAGAMQFPTPKRLSLGPLMDYGYEGEVLFPVALKVEPGWKAGQVIQLPAKVSWLVCRESCLPEKANLELDVPVVHGKPTANAALRGLFQRTMAALPKPAPASVKAGFVIKATALQLTVETGKRETTATFFPAETGVLDNPAPQRLTATAKGFVLELKKDAGLTVNPAQLRGVVTLSGGRAFEIVALPGMVEANSNKTEDASPLPGTQTPAPAANTTPAATQPVSAAQKPATKPSIGLGRAVGLAFLGGLLLNLMPCVFPVLFIKGLALVKSGSEERAALRAHGFVYTAGILVSFWILVAALLVLRAAGGVLGWGFQFQSPVFLSLMAGLLFFLGLSLAGQFEIGLSLTSAGGSLAAKQGYSGSFFTGILAVVVATPCTAPLMGAAIGYALAQPAAVTFAVFTALALGLAAPYVALTLQPAWTRILPKPGVWMEILKQATAVPVFGTVIWLAWVLTQAYGAGLLAALLAELLLLVVAGWFLGRWPAKRWATTVACLVVLGMIATAVYAPGKLAVAQTTADTHADWEPWTADAVSRYQAQGRPVFIDFSASWCLSCQVNERVALHQPEVQQAFANAHVALLHADWTQHDDAITEALTKLGRSGVPTYVLYVPGEKKPRLLPEILTPGIVTDAVASATKTSSVGSVSLK